VDRTTDDVTTVHRAVRTLLLTFVVTVVVPLVLVGALLLGLYTIQLICEL
jgi:hypothetical protein